MRMYAHEVMSKECAYLFDRMTIRGTSALDPKQMFRFANLVAKAICKNDAWPTRLQIEILLKNQCKGLADSEITFYVRLYGWLVLNALCQFGEEKKMPFPVV